ncbi:acyl-CoA dehydrogenase family protein [Sphingomonas sp. MMS24-JH45]
MTRERHQFGRAIGSFQAIKHMAADLLLESESATSAARDAARQLDAGSDTADAAVALAAFACADAAVRVCADGIQMHGGIAFTWDHPAHLYLRRARSGAIVRRRRSLARPLPHRPGGPRMSNGMTDEELTADVELARRASKGVPTHNEQFGRDPRSAWLAQVRDAGWAVPRWPEEWFGRGLDDRQARLVEAAFARRGAPGAGRTVRICGPTRRLPYATPAFRRASSASCWRARSACACSIPSPARVATSPPCARGPTPCPRTKGAAGASPGRRCGPAAPRSPTTAC